jgi:hypothetical protein
MNDPKDMKPAEAVQSTGELPDAALDQVAGGKPTVSTTLKSMADSKAQVQAELARFR